MKIAQHLGTGIYGGDMFCDAGDVALEVGGCAIPPMNRWAIVSASLRDVDWVLPAKDPMAHHACPVGTR